MITVCSQPALIQLVLFETRTQNASILKSICSFTPFLNLIVFRSSRCIFIILILHWTFTGEDGGPWPVKRVVACKLWARQGCGTDGPRNQRWRHIEGSPQLGKSLVIPINVSEYIHFQWINWVVINLNKTPTELFQVQVTPTKIIRVQMTSTEPNACILAENPLSIHWAKNQRKQLLEAQIIPFQKYPNTNQDYQGCLWGPGQATMVQILQSHVSIYAVQCNFNIDVGHEQWFGDSAPICCLAYDMGI